MFRFISNYGPIRQAYHHKENLINRVKPKNQNNAVKGYIRNTHTLNMAFMDEDNILDKIHKFCIK